eukprot:7780668-Pyramimonas_sp.AAC.1
MRLRTEVPREADIHWRPFDAPSSRRVWRARLERPGQPRSSVFPGHGEAREALRARARGDGIKAIGGAHEAATSGSSNETSNIPSTWRRCFWRLTTLPILRRTVHHQ